MLLDTSGLLCYHHEDEPKHQEAVDFFELAGSKLTHSYVVVEFVALAHARKLPRESAIEFLNTLLAHPQVEVIWVDEALTKQAITLLENRLDKGYSLCDAVSFVLMRMRGITEGLTTDHHFEQEGFQRLLVP